MYKIPVFLSRPQVEDIASEVQRQITHLENHIKQQRGQHGDDCCDGEADWLSSLREAQAALVVARAAFRQVRSEPEEKPKSSIVEKAQLRIRNLQNKSTNYGLPPSKGGIC